MEEEPALASLIVERAVDNVPKAMAEYAPDGAYPEGPSYWDYGTTFNVMLIAALESALGSDFGLSQRKAFLPSSDYYLHVIGPTGQFFNYSDCGPRGEIAPAMYWFAAKRNKSSLLWRERETLKEYLAAKHNSDDARNRLLPLLLIWSQPLAEISVPEELSYKAGGKTPIGIHRSGWKDAEETYVGLKGGSPSTTHAHMDIGSFVIDALGMRWAEDLGMQPYNDLESKGIKLWDSEQASQRWDVFRLNNLSHNTLVVNGEKQRVKGHAKIIRFSNNQPMPYTVIEMTSVYQQQLANAKRGIGLRADRSVLVQDEFTTPDRKTSVRWGMVTRAKITFERTNAATLELNHRKLRLRIMEPSEAILEQFETETPPHDFDAINHGTSMIGFNVEFSGSKKARLAVSLSPGETPGEEPPLRSLADW